MQDYELAAEPGQVQGIAAVVSCILNALFLKETRGDVLLSWRAKKLTKQTGRKHVCAADLQKKSFVTLVSVSLIRPFSEPLTSQPVDQRRADPVDYLITEPIVSALSAWIGFAWACIFLGGTSLLLVFEQYGFNSGELGSFQTWALSLSLRGQSPDERSPVFIGGVLGFISNYHQEKLYAKAAQRNGGRAPPEARLYWAAYGGLMFPLAMFAFAWTGRPEVPWPVPAVLLCISNWGVYCMYSGVL
jgi:hypothetical protein